MRQIVLDTETTGLFYFNKHRIFEIACIELINKKNYKKQISYLHKPKKKNRT